MNDEKKLKNVGAGGDPAAEGVEKNEKNLELETTCDLTSEISPSVSDLSHQSMQSQSASQAPSPHDNKDNEGGEGGLHQRETKVVDLELEMRLQALHRNFAGFSGEACSGISQLDTLECTKSERATASCATQETAADGILGNHLDSLHSLAGRKSDVVIPSAQEQKSDLSEDDAPPCSSSPTSPSEISSISVYSDTSTELSAQNYLHRKTGRKPGRVCKFLWYLALLGGAGGAASYGQSVLDEIWERPDVLL